MTRHPSHVRVARPAPDDSLAKMLAAFVDSAWPLTRREAETRAFGVTGYSATWAAGAVRELREAGYIERVPLTSNKYRATHRGVSALGVFRACNPDGGGAA